ncbi:hypothetical protein D3C85_1375120 [compost metagenome]
MHLVRHPDRRQTAGAVLKRKHLGNPPVCLDAIARLACNQRRRRDQAAMTHLRQLAVDSVATAAGLVAELQSIAGAGQPIRQLANLFRRVGDLATEPNGAIATVLCRGDADAQLVNIEPYKERVHSFLLDAAEGCSIRHHAGRGKGHTDLALVPCYSARRAFAARPT